MTDTQPKPQTALDLWNEQLRGLTDPAQSDAAINVIYERLMKLHGNFQKNGMDKQAGQVEEAYNLALSIYNDLQQRQTLIVGGAAAITESDRLRMEAVSNLEVLLTSIKNGDEAHPVLADYAAAIREDEHDETLSDPYTMESLYENAADQADEALYEMIMEAWDVSYTHSDSVIALLTGNIKPTPEQKELIQTLLATLPDEKVYQWGLVDPLASVARDLGAHSPDDETEIDEGDDDNDL